jgi:hypothetical protein
MLRIRDWAARYENNRTRDMKRMFWVPVRCDLSEDGYVELLDHPDGPVHFAAWVILLLIGALCTPRGTLTRDNGRPHDAASLARLSRIPREAFDAAIPRLLAISWLEETQEGGSSPQPVAETPQVHEPIPHPTDEERKKERIIIIKKERKESSAALRADPEVVFRSDDGDDDDPERKVWATPIDELKAIYAKKAGEPIKFNLLTRIQCILESRRVDIGAFVADVRENHVSSDWKNPPGLLTDLAKKFSAREAPAPITREEQEEDSYQCATCASRTRGHGLVMKPDGAVEFCECANEEYRAKTDLSKFRVKSGVAA